MFKIITKKYKKEIRKSSIKKEIYEHLFIIFSDV